MSSRKREADSDSDDFTRSQRLRKSGVAPLDLSVDSDTRLAHYFEWQLRMFNETKKHAPSPLPPPPSFIRTREDVFRRSKHPGVALLGDKRGQILDATIASSDDILFPYHRDNFRGAMEDAPRLERYRVHPNDLIAYASDRPASYLGGYHYDSEPPGGYYRVVQQALHHELVQQGDKLFSDLSDDLITPEDRKWLMRYYPLAQMVGAISNEEVLHQDERERLADQISRRRIYYGPTTWTEDRPSYLDYTDSYGNYHNNILFENDINTLQTLNSPEERANYLFDVKIKPTIMRHTENAFQFYIMQNAPDLLEGTDFGPDASVSPHARFTGLRDRLRQKYESHTQAVYDTLRKRHKQDEDEDLAPALTDADFTMLMGHYYPALRPLLSPGLPEAVRLAKQEVERRELPPQSTFQSAAALHASLVDGTYRTPDGRAGIDTDTVKQLVRHSGYLSTSELPSDMDLLNYLSRGRNHDDAAYATNSYGTVQHRFAAIARLVPKYLPESERAALALVNRLHPTGPKTHIGADIGRHEYTLRLPHEAPIVPSAYKIARDQQIPGHPTVPDPPQVRTQKHRFGNPPRDEDADADY